MRINFVQTTLSSKLKSLGEIIGRHPPYFLLFPLLLSCILGTGLLRVEYDRNPVTLGVDQNGRALKNKMLLQQLFPENTSSHVDISRLLEGPSGPIIYVLEKNGGNMINEDVFKEVKAMDDLVKNVTIKSGGREVGYKELCAKEHGECFDNAILKLMMNSKAIVKKEYRLKYPLQIDRLTFSYHPHIIYLGGVTTDDDAFVEDVKCFRLFYITDKDNLTNAAVRREWEEEAIRVLLKRDFHNIIVLPFAFFNVFDEAALLTESSSRLAAIVAGIVVLFSVVTLMSNSWVRSKPWLGVAACISGVLSLLTTFGLMCYIGVKNSDANVCIAFLIIGTEIDDAYVLIAAWRATNPGGRVEERLGQTFQDAAVSVTITSLTNILSLCIGLTVPFSIVKTFCIYAATAMCFTYVYQLSFFGACMALDGRREERALNPFTFHKVSGESKEGPGQEEKVFEEETAMKLFKENVGGMLSLFPVKLVVIIIFFLNLMVGVWGLFSLQHGSEISDTVSPNSAAAKHFRAYYKYFTEYPGTVQVIVRHPLNYADPAVQRRIEQLLGNFTSHPNVADSSLVISWLKYYKMFINHPISLFSMSGYNVSDKQDFVDGLRNVFLRLRSAKQFKHDILFNENGTEIISSRFLFVSKHLSDRQTEMNFLESMWKIADQSSLSVFVHAQYFPLIEQGLRIKGITIQITWVTAILVALVFFLFIPKVTSALFVSFTVLAIIAETVGYMSLWGVRLDMGSMTCLVLSTGLSVNYPSHASFAFVTSRKRLPKERLKDCLYHVGLPIFQGSVSTALGVSVLAFQGSYIFSMFFKVILLVTLLTGVHALFFLPTVLALYESCAACNHKNISEPAVRKGKLTA